MELHVLRIPHARTCRCACPCVAHGGKALQPLCVDRLIQAQHSSPLNDRSALEPWRRPQWPCEHLIEDWLNKEMGAGKGEETDFMIYADPLASLRATVKRLMDTSERATHKANFCKPCRSWLKSRLHEQAKTIWQKLPELFELPREE